MPLTRPILGWYIYVYFRMMGIQTVLYTQGVGFVGGSDPDTGTQQHLQWGDLACRGTPPPSSSPRVPASLRFENQPSGLAPHLLDVGLSGYRVVDAIDGEGERRQSHDGFTWNQGC